MTLREKFDGCRIAKNVELLRLFVGRFPSHLDHTVEELYMNSLSYDLWCVDCKCTLSISAIDFYELTKNDRQVQQ